MRVISEMLGVLVFLGLIGLGIKWAVDNVRIKKQRGGRQS